MGHQSLKQVTWLVSKTLKPKHSKPQPSQGCRNGFPLGGGRLSRTQATVTRLRWVCETHGHSKQINSGYKLFVIRQWRWCTFVGVDYASRSPWKTFGFETPVRSSRLQRFCFRFYMFHLRILSPTIVRPQLEDCLGNWWWQARVAPQKFPWLPEAARLYLSWYLEHIKRILTLFGVSPSSWQQRLRNDVIKGDISDLLGKAGFPDRVHVMLPHLPKFFSLFWSLYCLLWWRQVMVYTAGFPCTPYSLLSSTRAMLSDANSRQLWAVIRNIRVTQAMEPWPPYHMHQLVDVCFLNVSWCEN